MTQARLDVPPVLPERKWHADPGRRDGSLLDLALLDLETRAMRDLVRDDPQRRLSDMEAAIGLWAERTDLVDTQAYLRNLREDDRPPGPLSA
jgi:hypothetical protein